MPGAGSNDPAFGGDGRSAGWLIGLAIGDVLGAAVEFRPVGSFPRSLISRWQRNQAPDVPAWHGYPSPGVRGIKSPFADADT